VKEFEVHFVQGGPDIGKTLKHPNFHLHLLAPLLMEEADSSLYDPERKREVKEIFAERANQIEILCGQSYDHVIIELYPFGRRKFRKEVLFLLEKIKSTNPNIKVSCSLKDILVENKGSPRRTEEVVQVVQEHFHKVLVHSDPSVFRLEDTFPSIEKIEDKIVYTGFITEEGKPRKSTARKKF
jgi:predicted glycosyltransferase